MGLIPVSLLLAASFIVLSLAAKAEKPVMRNFGLVVATLLWVSIAVLLGSGSRGRCKMMDKGMSGMMQGNMSMPANPAPAR
jgi:hypothetical protein